MILTACQAYCSLGRKALGIQTHNVFVVWGLLSAVRCVYLVLVLSGYILSHNNNTIDYVLIEIPSFLYDSLPYHLNLIC